MLSVSTARSFISVLASVSRRCTARSASASGMRAASRFLRAVPCAASAASAACSASPTAACALSTAAASAARSGRLSEAAARPASILAISLSIRATRSDCSRAVCGELVAPRGEVGERAGQFAEGLFRGADHGIGLGRARIDAGAALGAGARFVAERLFFLGKLGQRGFGVGDERALARDVLARTARAGGRARPGARGRGSPRRRACRGRSAGAAAPRRRAPRLRGAAARLSAASSRPLPASLWAMVASATARTLKSLARSDSATSALAPSQRR